MDKIALVHYQSADIQFAETTTGSVNRPRLNRLNSTFYPVYWTQTEGSAPISLIITSLGVLIYFILIPSRNPNPGP